MSGERPSVSELLCADSCCLVLIDLQERLLPVIRQGETVLAVCQFCGRRRLFFRADSADGAVSEGFGTCGSGIAGWCGGSATDVKAAF